MEEAEISYTNTLPEKADFFALFETTGWNKEYELSADELYRALDVSWRMLAAYSRGRLIGFGRVISDGVLHAFIVDLIVLPEYQGQGIGGHILSQLTSRCKASGIPDIQLFCAKGKAGFYERHGFVRRSADAPGMQLSHAIIPEPEKDR
jgi:GNAT superfamily N-acetyltransferase